MTVKKKIIILVILPLCCQLVVALLCGAYIHSYVHYSLTAVTKDTTPEEIIKLYFQAYNSHNILLYNTVVSNELKMPISSFFDRRAKLKLIEITEIKQWNTDDEYYENILYDVTFIVTKKGEFDDYKVGETYTHNFSLAKQTEDSKWMIIGYGTG